jgi:hypothetical protein
VKGRQTSFSHYFSSKKENLVGQPVSNPLCHVVTMKVEFVKRFRHLTVTRFKTSVHSSVPASIICPQNAGNMIKQQHMTPKNGRATPKTVGGGLRFKMCIRAHFGSAVACKFIFDQNETEVARG